jgi:hypothetical protein
VRISLIIVRPRRPADGIASGNHQGDAVFEVSFQVAETIQSIDAEGLRVQVAYSGPETYWFFNFRRAMSGFAQRLHGIQVHYNALHSWYPPRIVMNDADYHLANCLFNMDSALECLVFGLNALGNGKNVSQFLDITNPVSLKQIKPVNIVGKAPCQGYATYFPSLQQHWNQSIGLIEAIIEYHDVTKHRHAIAGSGQLRTDPPPGFFSDIPEPHRFLLTPYAELILGPEVKLPIGAKTKDWRFEPYATLEQVMTGFKPFSEASLTYALTDMKQL